MLRFFLKKRSYVETYCDYTETKEIEFLRLFSRKPHEFMGLLVLSKSKLSTERK